MKAPRVVVVGGGITGLSAAFTLQEEARRRSAPLSLTLLEGGKHTGGHVRTRRSDGFLIEAGPNGFLSREPATLALIEELDLGPRLVSARPEASRRFILRDGRLCLVPEGPGSLLSTPALSWRGKLRLMFEPFAAAAPSGREETVHEFASRRIGPEAADMLVDAAVSGISAGDSRRLSVSAQFPMMTEMEREHGGLVRAMVARRRSGAGPSKLLSFDGGLGTLTDTLAERLGENIRSETPVLSIGRSGSAFQVVASDGRTVEAEVVILATSAKASAPLLHELDPRLSESMREIEYAGIAVVALGYNTADLPRALDGYGYLVTRKEALATLGVVWESSLFPGRAAAGTALLRVFLGGSRRPEVLDASEEQLVELATRELAPVMGITVAPLHVSVFRWPQAIAQYTLGHEGRYEAIRSQLRSHPGLFVCGTSYEGVSFNHAVKSGRLAAQRVCETLWSSPGTEASVRTAADLNG